MHACNKNLSWNWKQNLKYCAKYFFLIICLTILVQVYLKKKNTLHFYCTTSINVLFIGINYTLLILIRIKNVVVSLYNGHCYLFPLLLFKLINTNHLDIDTLSTLQAVGECEHPRTETVMRERRLLRHRPLLFPLPWHPSPDCAEPLPAVLAWCLSPHRTKSTTPRLLRKNTTLNFAILIV